MAKGARGGTKLDRTLDDDELGPDPEEHPGDAELNAGDTAASSSDGNAREVLEGYGMAGIDYTRRRYGMAGAGFVSTAAGKAEDARGGEAGDLIVLSVPAGELGRVMSLLEALGARPPSTA